MRHREPIRCKVKACPMVGYFDPADPLCPLHHADADDYYTPRHPTAAEIAGFDRADDL